MLVRLAPGVVASLLALALGCGHAKNEPPSRAAEAAPRPERNDAPAASKFHAFEAKSIDGETIALSRYAGQVVLVVNVASRCGFTKQYEGLEALYQRHRAEGFVILGFPCDQFGNQEPGTEAEIKSFCRMNYGVTFPMFAKIEVNGPSAHPLYAFLRGEQPGQLEPNTPGAEKLYPHLERTMPEVLGTDAVKWNFTKFLVDRRGAVVQRFESPETPEAIEPRIVAALADRP